jgi:polysaccharide export outer membrane protein
LPATGASREQVLKSQEAQDNARIQGIQVVDVNDAVATRLAESNRPDRFANLFADMGSNNYVIGPGDVVDVVIWEAPPAMLFGTSASTSAASSLTTTTAYSTALPTQMVDADGTISVPFAGRTLVKGQTVEQIEARIVAQLRGKANQPQVLVHVTQNNSSNVTIVGDVTNSLRMPLTPRGERLLDAVAAAGGVKQETSLMSLQLTRGRVTATMPVDSVIRDPAQNVLLKPGDVITALFQPQTFSVLGATTKNAEVPFEATGISLAQGLARAGGLIDTSADARGVFLFRFEDAKLLAALGQSPPPGTTAVPVVYQVNLRDPASFFVTQHFPIKNHDLIYVSNAPVAELGKILKMLAEAAAISRGTSLSGL